MSSSQSCFEENMLVPHFGCNTANLGIYTASIALLVDHLGAWYQYQSDSTKDMHLVRLEEPVP